MELRVTYAGRHFSHMPKLPELKLRLLIPGTSIRRKWKDLRLAWYQEMKMTRKRSKRGTMSITSFHGLTRGLKKSRRVGSRTSFKDMSFRTRVMRKLCGKRPV